MNVGEIEQIMWESVADGDVVKVVLKNGKKYEGDANWYSNKYDNEDGYAMFVVETEDGDVAVSAKEIDTIEVI